MEKSAVEDVVDCATALAMMGGFLAEVIKIRSGLRMQETEKDWEKNCVNLALEAKEAISARQAGKIIVRSLWLFERHLD